MVEERGKFECTKNDACDFTSVFLGSILFYLHGFRLYALRILISDRILLTSISKSHHNIHICLSDRSASLYLRMALRLL